MEDVYVKESNPAWAQIHTYVNVLENIPLAPQIVVELFPLRPVLLVKRKLSHLAQFSSY